jgi:hypothetical protein
VDGRIREVTTVRGKKTEVRRVVWRLRVVVGYDPKTGNPQQKSRTVYGTKKATDEALAAFLTEARTGTTIRSTDTLNALLNRWLEQLAPDLSPTTIRGYREKLNRVRRDLGEIKLGDLSAQKLDRAYAEWRKDGVSRADHPPYSPRPVHCAPSGREMGPCRPARHRPGYPSQASPVPSAGANH